MGFIGGIPATATPALQTASVFGGVVDAQHPAGSHDPATEVSIDGGATWGPAYLVTGHPWGNVTGTNSWVNCGPSLNDCLNATSNYRYRFWLASDFDTPTMSIYMIVDNFGYVYVNDETVTARLAATDAAATPISLSGASLKSKLRAGWNTVSVTLQDVGGLAGINYSLELSLYSSSPIQLVSPSTQYVITYESLGGTSSRVSETVTAGNAISSLATANRANHTFLGWWDSATGGSQVMASAGSPLSPSNSLVLYARWQANQYLIQYDSQGGTSPLSQETVTAGSSIGAMPTAARSGFIFEGWFDNFTAGNRIQSPFTPTSNTTLFARWQRIPPTPVQTDSVSQSATHCVPGRELRIEGAFSRQITNIAVNGVNQRLGAWTQTANSVSLTIPSWATSPTSIEIFNGAAPLLPPVQCQFVADETQVPSFNQAPVPNEPRSTPAEMETVADVSTKRCMAAGRTVAVFFAASSSRLSRLATARLDRIRNDGCVYTIKGFVQPTASRRNDMKLSSERAFAVAQHLGIGVASVTGESRAPRQECAVASNRCALVKIAAQR